MKKLALLLFIVVHSFFLIYAQVPEKINYQAVIRNASGDLLIDQDVGMKISILDALTGGNLLYSEEHNTSTNAYGQVELKIGTGSNVSTDFALIDWSSGDKYLKLEVDVAGGTSYQTIGTSQMLSVPFALYANNASKAMLLGTDGVYSTESDTLFVVKDHSGNVVFAIYPDGAELVVDETAKGKVGGFAVSGRTPSKDVYTDYLKVTSDSTVIFIDDTQTKGKVGGFAVSGRTPSKGIGNYFNVSGENTPITINPSEPRVVWFPFKEAFWAGRVLIEHPDSVGFNSLAVGYEAIAKGSNSQSLGYQTRARGDFSTALGYKTQANGTACFAVGGEARNADGTVTGNYTMAGGIASFALGLGANANGIANTSIGLGSSATGLFASTAFGVEAQASAIRATALGFGAKASAEESMAIGVASVASAQNAIAIGIADTAKAVNSLAMGVQSKATGIGAVAIGNYVEANSTGSFVVGQLNDPIGTDNTWNLADPLFVIGNGIFGIPGVISTAVRNNAFTILKNGNMGVGIDEPKRTVHIKDVLRLEPTTAPLTPGEGDVYYDAATHKLMVYDGTTWQACW